ncbi:histidine phosphatase family protein [Nocardia testacea]|uniref:histidine phosphatase family protein n=1 Tax=Nocardia testacea TaxID=248551 RepID=UPI003A87D512
MIISSPYLRAVRTLEPAARQWNLPIHTDPRLREWDRASNRLPTMRAIMRRAGSTRYGRIALAGGKWPTP